MARIYPICSSSKGNCVFIGTSGHGILVDAGCSFRTLKNALELINTDFSGIEAVFVTHEHTDHIAALAMLIKNTKIPIFSTKGTEYALKEREKIPADCVIYNAREGYRSAAFEVSCFNTSHDAAESVGYKIKFRGEQFGVCTDTGFVTDDAKAALAGCRTVYLESNHDVEMLRRNPNYSADLKRRILSNMGHLSNELCAEFAAVLVQQGTKHLVLAHLSQENNSPATALNCTKNVLEAAGFRMERDYTLNVAPVTTDGEFIAV
ncbi:MAG: MBL fold metallo-hydrolase [Oscillospiraceae bacterium]